MSVSSEAIQSSSDDGALKSLFERRLPQIIGIYIGAVWTFFGFVQWMVNRYVLSPHLEELVLLGALLFLPSVAMLAYGHGSPGRNVWKSYEKIGLTCNVLLAATVLFFMFGDKELGSAQKTVQIVDAEGNAIERLVPKEAFRKRLALFYFENTSGDSELDWLQEAIPTAWQADLSQDLFLTTSPSELFMDKFQKAGFQDGLGLPLALKRSITTDYNLKYFLTGSINKVDDNLVIKTTLHESKNGKTISTHEYTGSDLFPLIDQMTVELKNDLDLPKKHIEDTIDLPVSEILTSSENALARYRNGIQQMFVARDFPAAVASFTEATTEDPTFAMAHVQKYALLLQQGQMQPALQSLADAQQHNYRLTEQVKYLLKVGQLNLGGNQEEALEAANQWRTLYPDDLQAHSIVAMLYVIRNNFKEALEANQRIIAIDPFQDKAALEVGRLLKETGKTEEAIAQYEAYIEQYPDKNDGYNRLAEVYFEQGDLDKELETRKIALSVSPDPEAFRSIGDVLRRSGDLDEALKQYETALSNSKTPQEEMESLLSIGRYYAFRGQYTRAIEEYEKALNIVKTSFPAVMYTVYQGQLALDYYDAGYVQEMNDYLVKTMADPTTKQFPDLLVLTNTTGSQIYAREDKTAEALQLLDEADAAIEASSFFLLKSRVLYNRALVYQKNEQFAEAKEVLETYLETETTNASGWNRLGEVQVELGELEDAKSSFEKARRFFPGSPLSYLGLAKIAMAQGTSSEASDYLDKALAVWNEAEENFEPAQEANALRTSL
ncbi:MAG: tetratricopeptide repeat protein [Rhodothermales bacterium]